MSFTQDPIDPSRSGQERDLRNLELRVLDLETQSETLARSNGVNERAVGTGARPQILTNLVLRENDNTIQASWDATSILDLLYYDTEISTDETFATGVTSGRTLQTTSALIGLVASETHFVRVRAVNLEENPGAWLTESTTTEGSDATREHVWMAASL